MNMVWTFRTKNWIEINDNARGKYNKDSQIKFEISVLKSNLCDYSNAYILVSWTITITGAGGNDAAKRACERSSI